MDQNQHELNSQSEEEATTPEVSMILSTSLVNLAQDVKEQDELMRSVLHQGQSLISTYWWETGTTVLLLADQQNDMNIKTFSTETQL